MSQPHKISPLHFHNIREVVNYPNQSSSIRFDSIRFSLYSTRFDSVHFFKFRIRFDSIRLNRIESNRIILQLDSLSVSDMYVHYGYHFPLRSISLLYTEDKNNANAFWTNDPCETRSERILIRSFVPNVFSLRSSRPGEAKKWWTDGSHDFKRRLSIIIFLHHGLPSTHHFFFSVLFSFNKTEINGNFSTYHFSFLFCTVIKVKKNPFFMLYVYIHKRRLYA